MKKKLTKILLIMFAMMLSVSNTMATCISFTINVNSPTSITITPFGGNPPYVYSNDCGGIYQSSSTFSGLANGTYLFRVKDALGNESCCITVIINAPSQPLINYPTPIVTISSTNNCCPLTANVTGGCPDYVYSWSDGSTNQILNCTTPATYTVTVTDCFGNSSSAGHMVPGTCCKGWLLGGNNLNDCQDPDIIDATNNILGINEANINPLRIFTNASEKMIIMGGSGGDEGNVGINTTGPTEKLDVNGKVRIRNLLGNFGTQLVIADNSGVLRHISYTNSNDVLRGDGTFGAVPNNAGDPDWFQVGTTLPPTAMGQNIYTTGNVGIGTVNPDVKLNVVGQVKIIGLSLSPGEGLISVSSTGILQEILYPPPTNASLFSLRGNGTFDTDKDWFQVGTILPPTAMGQEIYHTGNVNVGKTTTARAGTRLDVSSNISSSNWANNSYYMTIGHDGAHSVIDGYNGTVSVQNRALLVNYYSKITTIFTGPQPVTTGSGPQNYAATFNGNINVLGKGRCTGGGNWLISDSTLKQNILNLSNALNTINQLQPKTFDFKAGSFPYLNLPSGNQLGFISQEVNNVIPDLVDDYHIPELIDSNGTVIIPDATFKGLNFNGFIPIAIAGIKELDLKVNNLSASTLKVSCPLTQYHLPKSATGDSICNSQIYDNGIGVGIGTNSVPVGYRCIVEGKFGCRDLIVACGPSWPDYVFGASHKLKPLDELENYVNANKHLPGIPTATEIEKEGINVGEMQTKQMEKIEELYRYIIDLNKNMQKLSEENKELKDRMKNMENK